MTATLERPVETPAPAPEPAPRRSVQLDLTEIATVLAMLALLVAACLPLARVYVGLDFLRPVLAAVFLAAGLSWGMRRLGAGPVWSALVSVVGWLVFVSTAFLGETLAAGVLPTAETIRAGVRLWARGAQLVLLRPAPTFAEAGLLLLTVTGVWAIAFAVEGIVFRLRAPLQAAALALVLWTVPLALAAPTPRAWLWAVPFLAATGALLVTFVGRDVASWAGAGAQARILLYPTAATMVAASLVVGVLLASSVPGYGRAPWFETRGIGGTTLTTNPIVDIKTRLVATNSGPVMHVSTPRPLYLRVTSLDTYSENEEWTNTGIQGSPIDGPLGVDSAAIPRESVRISVEVDDLGDAVLVPAPYQVTNVEGRVSESFQYDERNATVTLDKGATLQPGDRYSVIASVPAPQVADLQGAASTPPDATYTRLPENVPAAVGDLARRIVARDGATEPYEQALAIQNELRSWTYSTEPPQGHSARAMEQFLATRTGYCEQFAGTMAVMLRTLGIPSRVAVGYSPGELTSNAADASSGTYVVTNANAHAWVEVLFAGVGWIAFEPTPRTDGNVLVPTATNLAPERTVQQETPGGGEVTPADVDRDLPRTLPEQASEAAVPTPQTAPPAGGGTGIGMGLLLGILATVAVAGALLVVGRREPDDLVPSSSVLRARDRVERYGRGLGIAPSPADTDLEYLSRVAALRSAGAAQAARRLAAVTASARYAPMVHAADAEDARTSADALVGSLLANLPAWRKALVTVRGNASARLAGARRLHALRWLGYRSLSSRGPRPE